MEDYIVIDQFVDFLKTRVEDDLDDLLQTYLSEFNSEFNIEEVVNDSDLSESFYQYLGEISS